MIIKSGKLFGIYNPPISKAISQRALIIDNFIDSFSYEGLSTGEDILNLKTVLQNLSFNDDFDIKESGFSLRVIGILLLFVKDKFTLTMTGSLLNRPLDDLFYFYDYYNISYNLEIKNNKKIFNVNINNSNIKLVDNFRINLINTSQVLSGLFLLSIIKKESYTISINNLISNEYINLTINLLKKLGVSIVFRDNCFYITPPNQFNKINLKVEKDWNLASFFISISLLMGDLKIKNLYLNSIQDSKIFANIVLLSGGKITEEEDGLLVKKSNIKHFNFSVEDYQDLFFPIVLLAMFAKGQSTITGVKRLKYKESNRLSIATKILNILNIKYTLNNDSITIFGQSLKDFKNNNKNINLEFDCFNDHRACIFISLLLSIIGGKIIGQNCVNKSYPKFFEDLNALFNNIA